MKFLHFPQQPITLKMETFHFHPCENGNNSFYVFFPFL